MPLQLEASHCTRVVFAHAFDLFTGEFQTPAASPVVLRQLRTGKLMLPTRNKCFKSHVTLPKTNSNRKKDSNFQ